MAHSHTPPADNADATIRAIIFRAAERLMILRRFRPFVQRPTLFFPGYAAIDTSDRHPLSITSTPLIFSPAARR